MSGYRILRLVLAWVVAVSLAAAPLVTPAAAQATADSVMSSAMADMPCCPDDASKPLPDRCKDCATMILCAPQQLQAVLPLAAQAPAVTLTAAELTAGALPYIDDIGSSPPAPPPRS
jgi:hypothetical protein